MLVGPLPVGILTFLAGDLQTLVGRCATTANPLSMRAPEGHSVGDLQDFVLEGFQRQLSAPRQKSAHFLHLEHCVKT
jgi:hypothetical protein